MRLALSLLLIGSTLAHAAGNNEATPPPDFTKGDTIPKNAKHDWNLGATGLRGWMHTDKMVTSDARQIAITKVDPKSPAEGVIAVGDVILGVGGKAFAFDPRTELGLALTSAETEAGGGKLMLTRWRAGKTEEVVLKLPVLGSYSPTAPFECAKSKRILEQGCKALASRMSAGNYRDDAIPRSLNALALLASGDAAYTPLIKREAEWAAGFMTDSYAPWHYGYVMIFLSEYVSATGDASVLPGLRRLALEVANGQSAVGSWGHNFAKPDGRLKGYGMMNSPGIPLTIGLVLARSAGVQDAQVAEAIERSARLLRFYIGKGCIPYGDHHPWIENHEDNGKCGMVSVLFNVLGEAKGTELFARMCLASHGSERDTGHTGNFFNLLWAMPGVAHSGPQATGAWMQEFGAWYFDLARRWDGSFPHQGPPEKGNDSYHGWDCTGAYLLAYAMPLKKIHLTGKNAVAVPQLDAATAKAVVADGRDWTAKARNTLYDAMSDAELLQRLQSWSPIVRERAAMAYGAHKTASPAPLIDMLASPSLDTRYGACQGLIFLRGRAAPAVDALQKTLGHPDLWLRIKAAEALAAIGQPAMKTVPQLLELLAQVDEKNDPRGMQQRYLSFALFDRGGMLSRSLEGVDRPALYKAVQAGLKNQDGRARGSIGSVYRHLSLEEIKPLLPAIHEAIVKPAPSGEMFADQIRVEGLRVLAQHHIEEGMAALVKYTREQNPWASQNRTPEIMKILLDYGSQAKVVIPELERIANYFENEEPDFPKKLGLQKATSVRDTIKTIEASTNTPTLIKLNMRTILFATCFAIACAATLQAEEKLERGKDRIDTPAIGSGLCVHNLFQSNVVVQRDKPMPIWGWAAAGEKVAVSFAGNTQSATAAADRSWKVELPALPASAEPRTITVQGKDTKIELTNILVGDVWLLGGQSNMEFEIAKLEEGPLEILSANFDQIRLFTVPQQNGPEPQMAFPRQHQWSGFFSRHFRQGYWDVCSPETVEEMSGIGYVFARRIHMATRVPIGLVDVSRGGTSLVTWTPLEVLKQIDIPEVKSTLAEWDQKVAEFDPNKDLESRLKQYNTWAARMKAEGKPIPADRQPPTDLQPGPAADMNRPGSLFAATLSTIAGLPVKGAIWHQGYNDALMPNGHKLYARVFPEMIKAWRTAFNDPAMPFGIITQETQDQPQTLENFLPPMVDEGNYIREVHYQTFLNLSKAGDKNIGYASSFDQHRAWYHPQIKIPVGERIAKWALATQYGKDIRWLPPQLEEVKAGEGKLILKLDSWVIPFHDGPMHGFAIAGKDGRFQPAKAEWLNKNTGKGEPNWERSTIVLTSELVPEPVYFRYAWARNPLETLKSSDRSNLPFDTQRNDTFTLADMYQIYIGKKPSTPGVLNRGETRELVEALKKEDLKRRVEEAKKLLNQP